VSSLDVTSQVEFGLKIAYLSLINSGVIAERITVFLLAVNNTHPRS